MYEDGEKFILSHFSVNIVRSCGEDVRSDVTDRGRVGGSCTMHGVENLIDSIRPYDMIP
jgi:hypothetical protein